MDEFGILPQCKNWAHPRPLETLLHLRRLPARPVQRASSAGAEAPSRGTSGRLGRERAASCSTVWSGASARACSTSGPLSGFRPNTVPFSPKLAGAIPGEKAGDHRARLPTCSTGWKISNSMCWPSRSLKRCPSPITAPSATSAWKRPSRRPPAASAPCTEPGSSSASEVISLRAESRAATS